MATLTASIAKTATLSAATVDTVTLSTNFDQVFVVNVDGAAAIYATADGTTTPTVGGDDVPGVVAASAGAYVKLDVTGSSTVVKLISAGTPKYSVIGAGNAAATLLGGGGTGSTSPVSGTVTANQGTATGGTAWPVDTELPAAAALSDNTSNPTLPSVGVFPMVARNGGATWDRLAQPAGLGDQSAGNGAVAAGGLAYNGTGSQWDRLRTASATNIAANSGLGASLVAKPGNWAITHLPATATKATISQGAGAAGVRHVCTSVSFTYAAGASAVAAAAPMTVSLRDGASGAGTVLQSWYINVPAVAGESRTVTLTDLSIEGSAATAMTLEYAAAGGTNSYESVALTGYDVS